MAKNIIHFPQPHPQDPSSHSLPLRIYLSGRVQKLFGLKPSALVKDTETENAPSTWLSLWRCEHLTSDDSGQHLFLFTHATTFFSIVVYQQELNLDKCLNQFREELIYQLRQRITLPQKPEMPITLITGNPRSLVTTMNQVIYECEVIIDNFFESYEDMENRINQTLRSKEYFSPGERFCEYLARSPLLTIN